MEESAARLSCGMSSCRTGGAAQLLTRAAGPGTRHGSEGAPARGQAPPQRPAAGALPASPASRAGLCGVPVQGSCPASREIVSCSETVRGLLCRVRLGFGMECLGY